MHDSVSPCKLTFVGMMKMEMIKLGDLCYPSRGQIKERPDTIIDYIDISAIDNNSKTISGYQTMAFGEAPSRARKAVEKGNILVSTVRPNLNAIAILEADTPNMTVASTGFCVLECKESVDKRFVFNYCKSKAFIDELVSQATGASYPAVSDKIVREAPVPRYSYVEQKRIGETLDKACLIIQKRKSQLADLDDLIKARFVEMFGTYPLNEKGWPTGTIRELVTEVRYGSSRKAAEGGSGKYPYLRMNNITYSGELDLSDTKTIDIPEEELDKCTVRRGDLLFNRTNSKELVGKTCVYNRDELMVLAGFVVRVRLNEKALPDFVSAFMNTSFSKQMLLGMSKAAIGQANINAQELQSIGIYIPPIAMQREFVSFKAQIDKSKSAIQRPLIR